MASGTATITGKIGPGKSVTSLRLTNVRSVLVDMEHEVYRIVCDQGNPSFSFDDTATITWTISGSISTITIST